MKLLLSPHCDDETLFASYTLLRHKPSVLICFNGRRARHLPRDHEREAETEAAMKILGCKVVFARVQCDPADWYELEAAVKPMDPTEVWAPLPEPGGNLGHNGVGNLAARLWPDRTIFYTTYSGEDNWRSAIGTPVASEPKWADKKLRALDCYASQKMKPDTAFHFSRSLGEYERLAQLPPRGCRLNLGGGINPIRGFENLDKSSDWYFEDGLVSYRDDSVEAITISHALMYVDSSVWPMVFSEIARVLEPGGILRVTEDAIGAPGSSRPVLRPGASVPTSLELVREAMIGAGLDPQVVSPNVSLFYDTSLIQQNYGQPPDVFHIEGIKA
jgi:LmbE family N-acetylglucosaminyl deacetylase